MVSIRKEISTTIFSLKKHYIAEFGSWYKITDFGKQYLQVLSAERLKGERKRNLEDKMLKTNLTTAKFQFVISIFSLLVAVVAIIAPILIKDDKPTQVNIPEMKQIIETQKSLKENISDLQHKILIVDTIKDQQ
jgi:hypothetical protein